MTTQTIFQVKEEWRDDGASTYRVKHDGGQHDIYVKHGDLDENSIEWGTMEDDASLVEAFKAAWKRYHAEKAKRSVVVSAATMRPMHEAPKALAIIAFDGNKIVVAKQSDVGRWILFEDEDWEVTCRVSIAPIGWWPLPDLTFMPAQFGGWEV